MKEGIDMVNLLAILIFVCTIGGVLFFTKVGKRIRLRASGTADEFQKTLLHRRGPRHIIILQ